MIKCARVLCLVLAVFLLSLALMGCTGVQNTGQTESETVTTKATEATAAAKEEPLVIEYLSLLGGTLPEENNFIYNWLKENKNIDIRLNLVSEKQTDRMNLMLASGEIPDVVNILTSSTANPIVNKWGDAGLIIPVDEYIAKYPELVKFSDEKYNRAVFGNEKDGKLYMIPTNYNGIMERIQPNVGPFIREDWLSLVGMEQPKTMDELYRVLKAFKEKIPDVDGKKIIPATFNTYLQVLIYSWTRNYFDVTPDGKSLSFQWNNPAVEDALVYLNKLANEGLLDMEILTQTQEQYEAKLASGRVGFTVGIHTWMDNANKVLKQNNPSTRFVPNYPVRVEGKKMPVYATPTSHAYCGITISAKFAKNPKNIERLLEFLKWNMSDEGACILIYGPGDDFYEKNAEGLLQLKPEYMEETSKPNNTFYQRTGLRNYYNLMSYNPVPSVEVNRRTEESQMAGVWKEAWLTEQTPAEIAMQLTVAGSKEKEKWGAMWSEFEKWKAKAIYAESEEECRKAAKEMLAAYETNGGRDIVNERLLSIAEYLKKNK